VLKKPTEQLKASFWSLYEKLFSDAFSVFDVHVDKLGVTKAVDELMGYNALTTELGWADQSDMTPMKMNELLRRQVSIIVGKADDWVPSGCHFFDIDHSNMCVWDGDDDKQHWAEQRYDRNSPDGFSPGCRNSGCSLFRSPPVACPWHWEETSPNTWKNKHSSVTRMGEHPDFGPSSWTNVSPHDWTQVLGSLLLASSNKHFYLRFGQEKMLRERHLQAFNSYFDPLCSGIGCHSCPHSTTNCKTNAQTCFHSSFVKEFIMKGNYVNGVFTPDFPDIYKACVGVEVPELLSDPKHWGNPIWMCCEFKESQK
jgi:hypothetical protein